MTDSDSATRYRLVSLSAGLRLQHLTITITDWVTIRVCVSHRISLSTAVVCLSSVCRTNLLVISATAELLVEYTHGH